MVEKQILNMIINHSNDKNIIKKIYKIVNRLKLKTNDECT